MSLSSTLAPQADLWSRLLSGKLAACDSKQANKEPMMHEVTDELWRGRCALFLLSCSWVSVVRQIEWQGSGEFTGEKKEEREAYLTESRHGTLNPQHDQTDCRR